MLVDHFYALEPRFALVAVPVGVRIALCVAIIAVLVGAVLSLTAVVVVVVVVAAAVVVVAAVAITFSVILRHKPWYVFSFNGWAETTHVVRSFARSVADEYVVHISSACRACASDWLESGFAVASKADDSVLLFITPLLLLLLLALPLLLLLLLVFLRFRWPGLLRPAAPSAVHVLGRTRNTNMRHET